MDAVVLTGGASRGAFFRRLIAALFAPLPVFGQDENVSAAARGALFAHDREAARLRTRPVPPPPDGITDAIRDRYDAYRSLFARLSGTVRAGDPFRFRTEGS